MAHLEPWMTKALYGIWSPEGGMIKTKMIYTVVQ